METLPINGKEQGNLKHLAVIASGGLFECFDFMICAFMAKELSVLFFAHKPYLSTFGIFTVAFFSRPLGGLFWSHFGDKYGRKNIFFLSTLLMIVPTAGIALFPMNLNQEIYPFAFIFLRFLQGFFVGGEFSGAVTYISEIAPPQKKGLYISCLMAVLTAGTLLASAVSLFIHIFFTHAQIYAWGWRIPFLLSMFLIILVSFFRKNMQESPLFLSVKNEKTIKKIPFISLLREKPFECFQGIVVAFSSAAGFINLYLFFPQLFKNTQTFTQSQLSLSTTIGTFCLCLGMPFAGHLGDKMSRKKIFQIGSILLTVSFPLFALALFLKSAAFLIISMILVSFVFTIVNSNYNVILSEIFPTAFRFSGVSLAYNSAYALGGGLLPILYSHFSTLKLTVLLPGLVFLISTILNMLIL